MKWYFVLNSGAHPTYFEAAKIAVLSCLKNTKLKPHALYDGPVDNFTQWLEEHGVVVTRTTVPFLGILEENRGVRGLKPEAARGAYLRMMIPEVEAQFGTEEFVLYTDCDVIFQKDPIEQLRTYRPLYIGATAESELNDDSFFNSGVMIMNIFELNACRAALYKFVEHHLPHWHGFSCNDQGALNYFFRGLWEAIDPNLNWKPYWGMSSKASIIHYHGNRPLEVQIRLTEGVPKTDKSATRRKIFSEDISRKGMEYYNHIYFSYFPEIYLTSSQIVNPLISKNQLKLSFKRSNDLIRYRYFGFRLVSGDKIIFRDQIGFSSTNPYPYESPPIDALRALPWGASLRIEGEELPHISADVDFEHHPTSSDITAVTTQRESEIVLRPPTRSRIWSMPGISKLLYIDSNGEYQNEELFEDIVQIKADRCDPVYIGRFINVYSDSSGKIWDTMGNLLKGGWNDSDDGAIRKELASNLVSEPVALVRLVWEVTALDRLTSLLAQISVFTASDDNRRIVIIGEVSLLEQNILNKVFSLDVEILPNCCLSFSDVMISYGSGCRIESATSEIGSFLRSRLSKNFSTIPVLFVHDADEIGFLLAQYFIDKGIQTFEISKTGLNNENFYLLNADVVVFASSSSAEAAYFTPNHSSIIEIELKENIDYRFALRRIASLRNQMYCKITFSDQDYIGRSEQFSVLFKNIIEMIDTVRTTNAFCVKK